jgi:uncharacterized protein
MKMIPDALQGATITGYGPGWVAVNGAQHSGHLLVSSQGTSLPWVVRDFESLDASHFEALLALKPELVLFGSGSHIRFPQPHWLQSLYSQRIGVETMDTQAACRTFNFLAGEGRKVVAALLV